MKRATTNGFMVLTQNTINQSATEFPTHWALSEFTYFTQHLMMLPLVFKLIIIEFYIWLLKFVKLQQSLQQAEDTYHHQQQHCCV